MAIVSLTADGEFVVLIYVLWGRVQEHLPPGNWPFSKDRVHGLYDEVDVSPDYRRMYFHRILLSDGRVLEIPFEAVTVQTLPLP